MATSDDTPGPLAEDAGVKGLGKRIVEFFEQQRGKWISIIQRKFGLDEGTAEEIVDGASDKLRKQVRPDGGLGDYDPSWPLEAYLSVSILNHARSWLRKFPGRVSQLTAEPAVCGQFDAVIRSVDRERLRDAVKEALARLRQKEEEAIRLVNLHELPYSEAARQSRSPCTEPTMRARAFRARERLRQNPVLFRFWCEMEF